MTIERLLVTGATGTQGGAVARAAQASGMEVVAVVRHPGAKSAQALAEAGIALVEGDLEDRDALAAACSGCTAVFSVQPAPLHDTDSERRQARNLIDAARDAGIAKMVHTSVSATGWRTNHPDVDAGMMRNYWDSKEDVVTMVRDAGFATFTILKPAFMMENFVAPKVGFMFPHLSEGELVTASAPDSSVALIAAADIGIAAAAALTDPQQFAGAELELAGDALTFAEIAAVIAKVTDRPVSVPELTAQEVDARLGEGSWSATQTWFGAVGYPARPQHAAAYGIGLSTFSEWAAQHRDELQAARTPR